MSRTISENTLSSSTSRGDKSADKEVWTNTEVTESWEFLQKCGGERGTIHVPTGVRHPGDGGHGSEECEQSKG